jgi:hypothetical protein
MATPTLALFWDMDYPAGETGWQPATYRDGRPQAGILSMSTTWQRYPSMGGNANRHRANAVSKMFLCDDYLSRPIVLNRAAVDQLTSDPETAIAENPGCQSCHSSLDPLAANFYGFYNYDDDMGIGQTIYRPENEEEWIAYAQRPPGYFGVPTANLVEFAAELAADQRFTDCAVKTLFDGLTQRDSGPDDWSEVAEHTSVFLASDQKLKALARSIVLSEAYRSAGHVDPDIDARMSSIKTVSPGQLASVIEGLTGYRWAFDGRDGLTTNDLGLPVLAGGIDSEFVVTRNFEPSVGVAFIQERLAWGAAWHVASHDLDRDRTDKAILLDFVTIDDTPDSNPDAFDTQIRHLFLTITGEALSDNATEPADLILVWKQVHSVEASTTTAWAAVTSAVLRDPRILFF